MTSKNILLLLTFLSCSLIYNCNPGNSVKTEVEEHEGITTKTFYDKNSNIEAIIITESDSTLVAIPLTSVARKRKMGDEEYECLKKCKKADGSYDMDCVLLCPVTKQYQIYTTAYVAEK